MSIDRVDWVPAVAAARDAGADFFDVLTAVDLLDEGFELVLHLWDVTAKTGVLLRTGCPREDPVVPSLISLFAGAAWHERAVAELFGITFAGHDTVPLLLAAGFEGHPLRKDFLLASRAAKPWPGAKEPGESTADLSGRTRRRLTPPGTPPDWPRP